MSPSSINRRGFLKVAAVAGAAAAGMTAVGGNVTAGSQSSPGELSKHRWAMVIDQSKCNGCGYCTNACRAHNDINPSMAWNVVLEDGQANGKKVYLPRPCMHCQNAPCIGVCPVHASHLRPDGIVEMDYDRCIGCRYCQVACPYNARVFNWEAFTGQNPAVPEWGEAEVPRRPRGVAEKCTFCANRIDKGLEQGLTPGIDDNATPACAVACPQNARLFGDLNDPNSTVSKALAASRAYRLKEGLGTEPRVYYLPAHS
jgi:Fe-S-cluster-containing dehydrogenase component